MLSANETQLLSMIENSKDPAKAAEIAIDLVLSFAVEERKELQNVLSQK